MFVFQVDGSLQTCCHLVVMFVFQVDGSLETCCHLVVMFVFQVDGSLETCCHLVVMVVFQVDGVVQVRDVAPRVACLGRAAQTHQAELPGHEERRPQPHHEVHLPRVQKGHQQVRLLLRRAAPQTGSEYIHHHR